MKKFFAFILLITATAISVHAQKLTAKKLAWGFKTGINYSNLRVEDGTAYDWKTGLVVGAFFKIRGSHTFSLQPEFLYSSMGGKTGTGNSETKLRLNYFSIPVLAKYKVAEKLAVVAGPQIDILIGAKTKNKSNMFTGVSDNYREYSFNATGGVEFWPSHCFGLSVRYIYGLTNINPASSTTTGTNAQNSKNQGVQLTAAIKL